MSSTKIGLDFGTHQTKICMVDSSDPRNRRYLFLQFADLNGIERLTLPSLVQVNKDNTLSYGYLDKRKAMLVRDTDSKAAPRRPKEPDYRKYKTFPPIPEPHRPAILDKEPPKRENVISLFSDLKDALAEKERAGGKSHKQRQKEARDAYEKEMTEYKRLCIERESAVTKDREETDRVNDAIRSVYDGDMERYKALMAQYEETKVPLVYRYFKQAVFSTGMKWEHDISPMLVSIWYLTFVFFQLDKKYGTENLVVSMGTSSGVKTWDDNKRRATEMILTVYDLIERVFRHDETRFLNSTIDELMVLTNIVPFSAKKKEDNAIFVFPEAIANLQPLAKRKAFAMGLNLLVDIGGGTTDISLFTAPMGADVEVYDYQSLPFGLNSVIQSGTEPHFAAIMHSVADFTRRLETYAYSIHVPQTEVRKIANRRNVVFTGGGSSRNDLVRPYLGFTEIIKFKERFFNLMPTSGIQDVSDEIHVLSTALGLAMANENDSSIPLKGHIQLFSEVEKAYAYQESENGGGRYEHGISDD